MSRLRIHVWAPRVGGFGGGIAAFTRELVSALCANGHGVEVWGKEDRNGLWDGVRLRGAASMPPALQSAAFAARLLAACFVRRPELIISCHVNFGPVARLARRLLSIPFVLVAHGIDVGPGLSPGRLRALLAADGVWAVSRWTRDRLRDLGVAAERISILPNTVSDEDFSPGPSSPALRERYAVRPDEKVVLTVARLDAGEGYKGCDKVLQAWPAVCAMAGKVRYLVVGEGDDAPRLEKMAIDLGIADRLTLCGFVPEAELADHYRMADVFAMPSRGEGFGIVFLEAMASGVPVLGGNQDGAVDALADGELGCLVDPNDAAAIAKDLGALLQKKGPVMWFDPDALRGACLRKYGRKAFRGHVEEVLSAVAASRMRGGGLSASSM